MALGAFRRAWTGGSTYAASAVRRDAPPTATFGVSGVCVVDPEDLK
jgi:hypothetical protein